MYAHITVSWNMVVWRFTCFFIIIIIIIIIIIVPVPIFSSVVAAAAAPAAVPFSLLSFFCEEYCFFFCVCVYVCCGIGGLRVSFSVCLCEVKGGRETCCDLCAACRRPLCRCGAKKRKTLWITCRASTSSFFFFLYLTLRIRLWVFIFVCC